MQTPSWLDTQAFPFHPRTFATPDGTMSYVDEGEGPPVLMVHGTPSWSFEWRDVIQQLCGQHRCVAPDHLGFGLSDKPGAAGYTPADHARRLRAFVEALDLRDLTLVVHDFGGPIGLPIALDMPERVRRVIVMNTWMWPHGDDPGLRRLDRVLRSPLGAFLYRWMNVSPRVLLPGALGDRKALTEATHRHYLAPFATRAQREALYAMARALIGADDYYAELWARRDALAAKPLSFVWGVKDPAFNERYLQRWTTAFPAAPVLTLPHVGHFPAEEAPEAVARWIMNAQ